MKKSIKLSKWATDNNVTYQTAWNMFKDGKLDGAKKLGSGAIVVETGVMSEEEDIIISILVNHFVQTYGVEETRKKFLEKLDR